MLCYDRIVIMIMIMGAVVGWCLCFGILSMIFLFTFVLILCKVEYGAILLILC